MTVLIPFSRPSLSLCLSVFLCVCRYQGAYNNVVTGSLSLGPLYLWITTPGDTDWLDTRFTICSQLFQWLILKGVSSLKFTAWRALLALLGCTPAHTWRPRPIYIIAKRLLVTWWLHLLMWIEIRPPNPQDSVEIRMPNWQAIPSSLLFA